MVADPLSLVNRASSVLVAAATKLHVEFVLTLAPLSYHPSKRKPLFGVAISVTDASDWYVPPPDTVPPFAGEAEAVIGITDGDFTVEYAGSFGREGREEF